MKVQVRGHCLLRGSNMRDRVEVEILKDDASTATEDSYAAAGLSSSVSPEAALLQKDFPMATKEECQRYLTNFEDEQTARLNLNFMLEWREMYNLSKVRDNARLDAEDWERAWDLVWKQTDKGEDLYPALPSQDSTSNAAASKKTKVYPRKTITQYMYCHKNPSNPDELVIQVMPACINYQGASPEQHGLACNLYVDFQMQRHNAKQTAVFCFDCRGSRGWPNATVFTLLPIITAMTNHLVLLHPGRLNRMVLFPVPRLAVKIFQLIQQALPKIVQERTSLVAGSERNTDLPKMAEKAGVPLEILLQMQQTREDIQFV